MKKYIFLSILLLIILSQLVFLFPGKIEKYEPKELTSSDGAATHPKEEQVLKGGYMVESQSKDRAWEIWSDTSRKTSDDENWYLDQVKVHFYANENVTYVVTGDHGQITQNQSHVKIWKNVKVVTSNGYTMMTEDLYYSPADKKLHTNSLVDIIGPEEPGGRLVLKGTGLLALMEKNVINLLDNVQAERPMKLNRKMFITSKTASFRENSKSILFEKNVLMKVGTMKVHGPKATFKYKNSIVDNLLIEGGVKLEDTDKWGTAGRATVYFNEDKCVFDDEPNMTQGDDVLHGEQIVVLDQGNVIQVKGTRARYFQKSNEAKK